MSASTRRIAAIPLRGVEVKPVSKAKPELDWMDPRELVVEADYQRDLSAKSIGMIRRIAANWSWSKIKPAILVRVGNKLTVIDGQHTAIAAVSRGDIAKIPVMIVPAETLRERADAFLSQNRDRLALTPMHMHYAALAAGEEIAVAVAEACRKAKVTVLRNPPGAGYYKVGDTMAIGIIRRVVARIGAHQGGKVLKVLVEAKRAPLVAHEIAAVHELLFDPELKGTIEIFDLVTVIRSKSMNEWRAKAWQLVADGGESRRQAIASAWLTALKKKRGR
jgi:hypothetical protein